MPEIQSVVQMGQVQNLRLVAVVINSQYTSGSDGAGPKPLEARIVPLTRA